jgi:hypothetical protein
MPADWLMWISIVYFGVIFLASLKGCYDNRVDGEESLTGVIWASVLGIPFRICLFVILPILFYRVNDCYGVVLGNIATIQNQ